jgi:hypothetical protein
MINQPIKVIGVSTTNTNFTCEIVTVVPGRDYKIKVTPANVAHPEQSLLLIDTDYPNAPWHRVSGHLTIQ